VGQKTISQRSRPTNYEEKGRTGQHWGEQRFRFFAKFRQNARNKNKRRRLYHI